MNLVSKALNAGPNGQSPHVRARLEAEEADKNYRVAVRKLDRQRLGLEERLEETLKTLQRWELERLRAVKTGEITLYPIVHTTFLTVIQFCCNTRARLPIFQSLWNHLLNVPAPSSPRINPSPT